MKPDIDKKLIELLYKHCTIPKDCDEKEIERDMDYQLEYCNWYVHGTTGDVHIGGDVGSTAPDGHFRPMGIFYGQDENMEKVEQEFKQYLLFLRGYVVERCMVAVNELRKERLVPDRIQIPNEWFRAKLGLGSHLFGLPIEKGSPPIVLSEPKFGRFVEFEL